MRNLVHREDGDREMLLKVIGRVHNVDIGLGHVHDAFIRLFSSGQDIFLSVVFRLGSGDGQRFI
jgi:hypothetical protein